MESEQLFKKEPVFKVILRLAVPTIISQVILVIYNMADTFFIGLTESDVKLSAVTICLPAFMLLSAIANLFGIGGSCAISRAEGAKDPQRAEAACSYAVWGCISVSLFYGGLFRCR